MMTRQRLTILANEAAKAPQMVANYPDPSNSKVTFPPSPYYRFLRLLALDLKSRLSVELGVCGGGGSLHLAMASTVVVGVDVAFDYEDNITWITKHYPNFKFIRADSVDIAPVIF